MIDYINSNAIIQDIMDKLRSHKVLDNYIMITLKEIPTNQYSILGYMVASKMFEHIEKRTNIIFNKSFAAQIIEKYIKRGDEYLNSMESYYDIMVLEEACQYKLKFVKLSQKTSQIKNRRKIK